MTEEYFAPFRRNILGINQTMETPYGKLPLIYADWIASGRLFGPIEDRIREVFGPWMANTHSEASESGRVMTEAYHQAQRIIKAHVNAGPEDVLVLAGSGMTAVVNKFQRILGLRVPEQLRTKVLEEYKDSQERPVVFLTHMEHHSNHTSWLETVAEVVVLEPDSALGVDPASLERALDKYRDRKVKLGSFTAGSNVTGIVPPYRQLARIMHRHGGFCFMDFAASAPYVDMDMHPADPEESLDAIMFSPHKFLGGPGTPGVLVFHSRLYRNQVPDQPGGGTVLWTNRWGEYHYLDDIEAKEDGGTPAILQTIRAALAIGLKDQMGTEEMARREKQLLAQAFLRMESISGLRILAPDQKDRLGVISFYFENLHYNLVVRLLSDRYGIQVRGGCSCAGTYGHYLLNVDYGTSRAITCSIDAGDLTGKPGWVRLSLHPTMTDGELETVLGALEDISRQGETWAQDYEFNPKTGEFDHKSWENPWPERVASWFGWEENLKLP